MTKANCLLLWVKTVEIKGNRCAIYARVSTKKQADNGNLIRQLERLQGIAKRRKYAVVAEYQEVASGLNENRKELSKLLKIIAGGQVNIVLIEYRDRLARFGYKLSTGTVMDFFRGLVTGLGEEPKFRKVDLFHQIQKAVLTFYQERKITPVFILDEMQLAKDLFLHDLSIIFNFGMDSENPFILVISGLPYMQDKLSLNHNRPLSQRLVMRYKIEPLNKDEVAGYIRHYMSLAGAKHDVFSDVALGAIASHSRGWPRLVNNLATHCLLCGYQAKKELIDEEVVRLAIQEMGL